MRVPRVYVAALLAATTAAAFGGQPRTGLHIPQGRRVNFTHVMTDGKGFRWDIQHNGNVGQATNYAYSGGLYCQINGSNVSSNGNGWLNAAGDEMEIGPHNYNNLQIHRRIKVYKDRGLARWMDIFTNNTSGDIRIQVQIYSYINYGIGQTLNCTGKGSYNPKTDYAFITVPRHNGNNTPSLLHLVTDKRAKVRPTVQTNSNQLWVRYPLTIPAGKTVILCYFEAQSRSEEEMRQTARDFRAWKLLRDLKPGVRRLIVNLRALGGLFEIDLDRREDRDAVVLTNGDPIYGEIRNTAFKVQTAYGPVEISADKALGMVAGTGEDGTHRIVLNDGQMVAGRLPGQTLLFAIPSGGVLEIPFDRVKQCAFRVSETRPEDVPFDGPYLALRTGDRLAFDPASVALSLRTRNGVVALDPEALYRVALDEKRNGAHRAAFLNGSALAGLLGPATIVSRLRLGPQFEIARDLISGVQFAAEDSPNEALTAVELTNGDKLFGRLDETPVKLRTPFATVKIHPRNIRTMAIKTSGPGGARVELWDGSVLQGTIRQEHTQFHILPGPTVKLHLAEIKSITRTAFLPPRDVQEKVEKLIARLGAESYADRQKATEALIKLGPRIVPLLRSRLETKDPEIRQRLETVIEKLGGSGASNAETLPQPFMPVPFCVPQRAAFVCD